MYEKVSSDFDFVSREKVILGFWEKNHIFEKSVKLREGQQTYTFYDGPPTANGKPHIGHVLTRVIKDMIPRYHTMKGEFVPRKAGWDTHGLPVEIEVEKELGIDGKEQIENYGLEPFINKCKESVWKYKGMWEEFSGTVGFWADMDDPYVTYHNSYIESVWWSLKEIWNKDLLYKGFKIVPYCPRCGTPLSTQEVAQGYKDIKERSAFVRFKVKDEDAFFLAWTTTPWTLPSNVALCVNPDESYIKLKNINDGSVYYMARALADTVLDFEYKILAEFLGKDLEYKEYEPLFDFAVSAPEKGWYVTCASFVTLSDGTGIVHIAPAFGEDDATVGRAYKLPFLQLVDLRGNMTAETKWPGMFCKDADKEILIDLEKRGLLFSSPVFEHSYPHCWRCDTPLIYYARDSWYINMTKVKDRLIANNNTINWIPESIGKGRFGDWIQNVQDWAISRNRYWGTPLNIWECECGHRHCIGSIAELKELSDNCPDEIELHRPYIDEVTIKCANCGGEMKRVAEVIDCWYDSGAMPFAQHHYPFENKEVFKKQFPAEFISEAVDQTRGWFYSLLAISTLIFDKAPYKNVLVLGHVQDENGQKMSKSKGNAVDPFDALATFGADAVRWYFYTNSAPWLPNRFHAKAVTEGQRKFMGTLLNTYAFFVLYANIDNFDASKHKLCKDSLTVMDKWLLSRLNTLIDCVDGYLAQYFIPEAAKALSNFTDDLSNWYVRRGRERFWVQGLPEDKINAYMTLYTTLVTVAKLAAPMIPFLSEDIYRNLVCSVDKTAPISVHLCDYPVSDPSLIDEELENNMQEVLKTVVLGRCARNGANIKNRQPLSRILVSAKYRLPEGFLDIVKDELNVKAVEYIDDASKYISYSFKPQLKTLGPKFGKQLGDIRTALSSLNPDSAKKELDESNSISLNIGLETIVLDREDLLIETNQLEGFFAVSDADMFVVLDTELSAKLIDEGFVRELISKIQTMRKEAGFNVMDRIKVSFSDNKILKAVFENNFYEISLDVLADELACKIPCGYVKDWDVNGEKITIGVERT